MILDKHINSTQNVEDVAYKVCEKLNVPVTQTTLADELRSQPDYPTLLSISNVFHQLGISNLSLRISDVAKLESLPTPFIAQIFTHTKQPLFSVVYHISGTKIDWYNPETHRRETISRDRFIERFSHHVQLFEPSNDAGESDYSAHRKAERHSSVVAALLLSILSVLSLSICINAAIQWGFDSALPILHTVFTFVGVLMSFMLLLYEAGSFNPTLQKICSSGTKTNCTAILHSKGSKIWGFEWSVIGFSYFMAMLIMVLVSGIVQISMLKVMAYVTLFALPYTVYSIYYQAFVVKQWCPLCLGVQGVLILQFVTLWFGGYQENKFSLDPLPLITFGLLCTISFVITQEVFDLIRKAKEGNLYRYSLAKIKRNIQIFNALSAKQKRIELSTDGLGITLGNPNGKYHIVKVCNPYCSACVRAHSVMDGLLKLNSEVKLQIIFTAELDESDYRLAPVRHLMALTKVTQNRSASIEQALDDWYLAPKQDYASFASRYPMEQSALIAQHDEIRKMKDWCEQTGIQFTPTFFVNNHQLPELYSVSDLRYLLSE